MKTLKTEKALFNIISKLIKEDKVDYLTIKSSDEVSGTADPSTHYHKFSGTIDSSSGKFNFEFMRSFDEKEPVPGIPILNSFHAVKEKIATDYSQAPENIDENTPEAILKRKIGSNKKISEGKGEIDEENKDIQDIVSDITYGLFKKYNVILNLNVFEGKLFANVTYKKAFSKPIDYAIDSYFKNNQEAFFEILRQLDGHYSVKNLFSYSLQDEKGNEIKREQINKNLNLVVFCRKER